MDPELNLLFNQVSYDLRGQFNELISEVSEPHKNNIDWCERWGNFTSQFKGVLFESNHREY